jgi:hypothetical protein
MTRTNAFSVLCVFTRAFALWLFASTLLNLPEGLVALDSTAVQSFDHGQRLVSAFITMSACLLVVAVILWIFADKLAKLALARPQQVVFDSDIQVSELQALVFSVVGLWQAVTGIVDLAYRIFTLVARNFAATAQGVSGFSPYGVGWLITDCVKLLIGLSLLFGARGLVGIIRRYRQIGYTHADEVDSSDPEVEKSDPMSQA